MSTTHYLSERAKYSYILQLSKDQIRALEMNDMAAFDKILAAKRTIINSLTDARSLVANDPTLMTVVEQIKDSDKLTERLLYRRVGEIRRKMDEIQQFQMARRAYKKIGRKSPSFVTSNETPMVVDIRS